MFEVDDIFGQEFNLFIEFYIMSAAISFDENGVWGAGVNGERDIVILVDKEMQKVVQPGGIIDFVDGVGGIGFVRLVFDAFGIIGGGEKQIFERFVVVLMISQGY